MTHKIFDGAIGLVPLVVGILTLASLGWSAYEKAGIWQAWFGYVAAIAIWLMCDCLLRGYRRDVQKLTDLVCTINLQRAGHLPAERGRK